MNQYVRGNFVNLRFGEDTGLIKLQALYLNPLFESKKCIATAASLESVCGSMVMYRTLFTSFKSLSFKEITDVLIGLEESLIGSVETCTVLHECFSVRSLIF